MTGRTAATLLGAFLWLACGDADGGIDTHEKLLEAMVSNMEQLAGILESVDSREAADAAAPELHRMADRMTELVEAKKKLGPADEKTLDELQKSFQDRIVLAMVRIGKAGQAAGAYIDASPKCTEAFQRVGDNIQKLS